MTPSKIHPRDALLDDGESGALLPVCDHYAGTRPRMLKSLELQAQIANLIAS